MSVTPPDAGALNVNRTTGAIANNAFNAAIFRSANGIGTGSGSVTSVALSLPSIITVSGSPVTTTGTLTGTLATQVANTIFSGPTTGADATPTFRALVAADIPSLSSVYQSLSANLTSWAAITRASGFDTFTATPSGANLASLLTTALPASKGGTGLTSLGTGVATALGNATNASGGLVTFSGNIGAATATTVNGNTLTTGTGTLTFGASKVLTVSNTLTLASTDGSTLNVGAGGTLGTAAFQPQTVLTGTANEITVSNAGVGATTLSLPSALTFTGKTVTGGTFASGAFNGTLGATTPSSVVGTTGTFTGGLTNTTGGVMSNSASAAPFAANWTTTGAFGAYRIDRSGAQKASIGLDASDNLVVNVAGSNWVTLSTTGLLSTNAITASAAITGTTVSLTSSSQIMTLNTASAGLFGFQAFQRSASTKARLDLDASDNFVVNVAGSAGVTVSTAQAIRFNAYGAGAITSDSSGNLTAVSDERAKDIVGAFKPGLAVVRKLTPKIYHWKPETGLNTADVNVSLIAQDIIAAGAPEAVSTERTREITEEKTRDGVAYLEVKRDAKGAAMTERVASTYTVSDRAVISVLVNAIKELAEQNDALASRVLALEQK